MPASGLTLYDVIKALALPPGSLIVMLVLGLVSLIVGWRRLGVAVLVLGVAAFYALSTPLVAAKLGELVQAGTTIETADVSPTQAEAIVVLAAGVSPHAPEYGGRAVDAVTLQRLAYAAYLWRQKALPILVSGGSSREAEGPLAALMKQTLELSFGVPVEWTEDRSTDTYENAQFSAEIFHQHGISRILLVTHAAHMPRAAELFRAAGLAVIPAPTAFAAPARSYIGRLVPRQSAFEHSYTAIYEFLGGAWYVARGRMKAPAAP